MGHHQLAVNGLQMVSDFFSDLYEEDLANHIKGLAEKFH